MQPNTAYMLRGVQSRLPPGRLISLSFELKQGDVAPTTGLNGRRESHPRDYKTYAAYLAHCMPNGAAR